MTYVSAALGSFSIGANTTAIGMATSYGTKALPVILILLIACITEFVGGAFMSKTIRTRFLASKMIDHHMCWLAKDKLSGVDPKDICNFD